MLPDAFKNIPDHLICSKKDLKLLNAMQKLNIE